MLHDRHVWKMPNEQLNKLRGTRGKFIRNMQHFLVWVFKIVKILTKTVNSHSEYHRVLRFMFSFQGISLNAHTHQPASCHKPNMRSMRIRAQRPESLHKSKRYRARNWEVAAIRLLCISLVDQRRMRRFCYSVWTSHRVAARARSSARQNLHIYKLVSQKTESAKSNDRGRAISRPGTLVQASTTRFSPAKGRVRSRFGVHCLRIFNRVSI